MSTAVLPTLRDIFNSGDPAEIAMAMKQSGFGDWLASQQIGGGVNVPAATVGTDIAAFSASYVQAELNTLRTFVNALKADLAAIRTAVTSLGGVTEQALVPSSSVVTLANVPSKVLVVNLTAVGSGGTTGVKKVRTGEIAGTNALSPGVGEAIWDGQKKILLNASDIGTGGSPTVNVDYVRTADTTPSVLQQQLGIA